MFEYTFENPVYKNEFFIRGAAFNSLYKLKKDKELTVAYLGGSITQSETWSKSTTKWLRENYKAKINEINIGLSGTEADLAVCRIDSDVLVRNPDLVFIEYAVNGGRAKDMEGMALKIRRHNPQTDIIFVYTTTIEKYNTYKEGRIPEYPAIFEEVAKHYDITSIFFANQLFDLYEQGKIILAGSEAKDGKILYTKDGTHMTASGGWLAAGAIARCFTAMEKDFDADSYTIKSYDIPKETYDKSPWINATCSVEWEKMRFEGEWFDCSLNEDGEFENYSYDGEYLETFKKVFKKIQGTKTAGSSVTVKFRGTDIGIFEAGGQYSGQLIVTVDGERLPKKLVLYNKYYGAYIRHQYYFLKPMPYGEHTVTFEFDSEMPDKSALKRKHPQDKTYEKNEIYLGRILLNGELLAVN
ncbi:MAG: SGNH/GDSL hydrolase family protein [Oscillospiraceae bacterium]|nr:SGNH/GDSL hydrolase family protein [Oscillospiraceae bacterium]